MVTAAAALQELEAAAMRSGREWDVLQRGSASLTHLLDKFRENGDAAAYARTLIGTFRGAPGVLRARMAATLVHIIVLVPCTLSRMRCA